jgi:hypothetical protein
VVLVAVRDQDVIGPQRLDINGGGLRIGSDEGIEEQDTPAHFDRKTGMTIVSEVHINRI